MTVSDIRILKNKCQHFGLFEQINRTKMKVIIIHVTAFFVNVLFAIILNSRLMAFDLNYALNRGKENNLYDITIHESIFFQKGNRID